MSLEKADLELIYQKRLADVEQAFKLGTKLYAYELAIGTKGIGLMTLLILVSEIYLVTSSGLATNNGFIAVTLTGLFGFISIWWLRCLVIKWQKELLQTTNFERKKAYQQYLGQVDGL